MRILYVVPNVPSRIRVRPFNLIRWLSREHEVSVLCVATNEADRRSVDELRQHCRDVEVFYVPRWRSWLNCLPAMFSRRPLRTAYFYSPQLRKRLKERVGRNEVDLLHAEHLKTAPMVAAVIGRVPIVFDAVDCISIMEVRRRKVVRNPLVKFFSWIEERKMRFCEAWAADRFDGIVISSSVDKGLYPPRPSSKYPIRVVPNCIDLEYFGFQQIAARNDTLIFCANLAYFPNEDAALYLSRYIWPALHAERPNLRLEIVGSRPPEHIRRLDGRDNIRVFASVPDVRPYLARATLALCPVRVQAGTQNKILEAMALGVPVVATRNCCRGIDVEPGQQLLVADTPDEFFSAIRSLLDDKALRERIARAGRAYVESNHGWDRSAEKLLQAYTEVLSGLRKGRAAARPRDAFADVEA